MRREVPAVQAEYVDVERARAMPGLRLALTTGVPTTFGVITALSEEQAWARAGGDVGNRGEEAAEAALQMAEWIRQLGDHRAPRSPARPRQGQGHARRR